jgi:hypothetical protein
MHREVFMSDRDNSLKEQLVKLGSEHPDLRDHIRPVLDRLTFHPNGKSSKTAMRELMPDKVGNKVEEELESAGFRAKKTENIRSGVEVHFSDFSVKCIRDRGGAVIIATKGGNEKKVGTATSPYELDNIIDDLVDMVR